MINQVLINELHHQKMIIFVNFTILIFTFFKVLGIKTYDFKRHNHMNYFSHQVNKICVHFQHAKLISFPTFPSVKLGPPNCREGIHTPHLQFQVPKSENHPTSIQTRFACLGCSNMFISKNIYKFKKKITCIFQSCKLACILIKSFSNLGLVAYESLSSSCK